MALAERRRAGHQRARRARRWRPRPRRSAADTACQVTAGRRRHHDRRGPRSRPGRLPGARHPGQQRRRPAARRLSRLGPRGLDRGARRQHADADRAHQGDVDGMAARGFGRIVNITSGSVKAPIDVLGLSNGARAGLTGFVAGRRARRSPARASPSTTCCPAASTPTGCEQRWPPRPRRRGQRVEASRAAGPRRNPGRPLRHAEEFGAALRLPVQRPCRLHHRPEPADRRRRLSRDDVRCGRAPRPGWIASAARPFVPSPA